MFQSKELFHIIMFQSKKKQKTSMTRVPMGKTAFQKELDRNKPRNRVCLNNTLKLFCSVTV